MYPPSVYSAQFNSVTSLLISYLVRQYPGDNTVLNALRPFVKVCNLPIQNGFITLPADFRNILGTPSVNIRKGFDGECKKEIPITTPQEFAVANQKGACQVRPVIILPKAEFDYRTTYSYNYPTYKDHIGYFYADNQIKVCPFDLTKVQVMYVRQEGIYQYGYIMQPDDTFIFDPTTTIESEWGSSSFSYIYKAMMILYSAYTRDSELKNWSELLIQEGFFE